MLAAISSTSAPSSLAARAKATPCLPDEKFPINLAASIGSLVPPAVTSTRFPLSGPPSAANAVSKISSGSASLPAPESSPVSLPTAGHTMVMPRSVSVSMFAVVALFSHISVCMAGATITGQVAASTVVVRRSSAIPDVIFAINDAVAGATTTRSADFAKAICFTWSTSVNRSGSTIDIGFPDSASRVVLPMNLKALLVATTWTECPASENRRINGADLYAAIPPVTPTTTLATCWRRLV